MDLEIISVDLKVSLLEMKGKVPLHLNSPNCHHNYGLFSNWRLPFINAKKNLMLQVGKWVAPWRHPHGVRVTYVYMSREARMKSLEARC